jgi:hypothetical protein
VGSEARGPRAAPPRAARSGLRARRWRQAALRVLAGTLYTEENEIDQCLSSIRGQAGIEHEHFLIEGLPKGEAHRRLYGSFMARATEFDLFVKVDADMVLVSDSVFRRAHQRMAASPHVLDLCIAVSDFLSRRLILGMHCFRSSVTWPAIGEVATADERLFTDRCPVEKIARLNDYRELAPAALHCPDPSPFQSFHYGLHRGAKLLVVRSGRAPGTGARRGHALNREATWRAFLETGDRRRGWACMGYELALGGELGASEVDFGNVHAREVWSRYEHFEAAELEALVRNLRAENDAAVTD